MLTSSDKWRRGVSRWSFTAVIQQTLTSSTLTGTRPARTYACLMTHHSSFFRRVMYLTSHASAATGV